MNNNHLQGKTAIITGAGYATLSDGRCGSIGYGIATAFAKEGANLVITGRQVPKLEKAKAELERLYGVKVLAIPADISAGLTTPPPPRPWWMPPWPSSAALTSSSTTPRPRPPA